MLMRCSASPMRLVHTRCQSLAWCQLEIKLCVYTYSHKLIPDLLIKPYTSVSTHTECSCIHNRCRHKHALTHTHTHFFNSILQMFTQSHCLLGRCAGMYVSVQVERAKCLCFNFYMDLIALEATRTLDVGAHALLLGDGEHCTFPG